MGNKGRAATQRRENGYAGRPKFRKFIPRSGATRAGRFGVFAPNLIPRMKTDHSFKIISVVIIAGVIAALVSPSRSHPGPVATVATPALPGHE